MLFFLSAGNLGLYVRQPWDCRAEQFKFNICLHPHGRSECSPVYAHSIDVACNIVLYIFVHMYCHTNTNYDNRIYTRNCHKWEIMSLDMFD